MPDTALAMREPDHAQATGAEPTADAETSTGAATSGDTSADTIAAIATPPGVGGIGIVRVSGPDAFAIGRALFRPARGQATATAAINGRPTDEWTPTSHMLTYGHVVDPTTGEPVDEVLAAFMRAPHTYTREDVVEINAHGGPLALGRILALALAAGARGARPGEMTLRAFLNGRLDLAQAEAVMALIRAESDAGLRLAMRQLGGALSARVREARAPAMAALVRAEAGMDFPEEEVPPPDRAELRDLMDQSRARVTELLAGAGQGRVLREGLRVAILGRPNVGKSSLLNALLGTDRAIVTPVAGTTRDTIEETATLRGAAVHLVDTAGLAETADPVERAGVERARAAARVADLALLVLDGAAPLTLEDIAAAAAVRALGFGRVPADNRAAGDGVGAAGGRPDTAITTPARGVTDSAQTAAARGVDGRDDEMPIRPLIVVRNKTDLPPAWDDAAAVALVEGVLGVGTLAESTLAESTLAESALVEGVRADGAGAGGAPLVHTSAVAAGGVTALEEAIAALALGGTTQSADPLVASARHADALRRAEADLARASAALADGVPLDLVSLDMRDALNALGEITGETATADLLDRIFAEFCIGK